MALLGTKHVVATARGLPSADAHVINLVLARAVNRCRVLAEPRQSWPESDYVSTFRGEGVGPDLAACGSDHVSTFRGDECRSAMSLSCPRRTTFQRFATTLGVRPRLVAIAAFAVASRGNKAVFGLTLGGVG